MNHATTRHCEPVRTLAWQSVFSSSELRPVQAGEPGPYECFGNKDGDIGGLRKYKRSGLPSAPWSYSGNLVSLLKYSGLWIEEALLWNPLTTITPLSLTPKCTT